MDINYSLRRILAGCAAFILIFLAHTAQCTSTGNKRENEGASGDQLVKQPTMLHGEPVTNSPIGNEGTLPHTYSTESTLSFKGMLVPPSKEEAKSIHNAHVTLDSGLYRALVGADGGFTFYDIPIGAHVIDARLGSWVYDPVRIVISVGVEEGSAILIRAFNMATERPLSSPYSLDTGKREVFFVETKSFDYISLIKSPMVLMLIFTGFLMFAMPRLVGAMSPEELEQFRKSQSSGGLMGMLQTLQQPQEESAKPKERLASPQNREQIKRRAD